MTSDGDQQGIAPTVVEFGDTRESGQFPSTHDPTPAFEQGLEHGGLLGGEAS